MGIVWDCNKSHHEDPYEPISIMEYHKGFECFSFLVNGYAVTTEHLTWNVKIDGFFCKGLTISGFILNFRGIVLVEVGGRLSSEIVDQLNLIDMLCLQYTFNHPSKIFNPTFLGG